MNADIERICERLVERGKNLLDAPAEAQPIPIKKPPDLDRVQYQEARSLINDLKQYPHAFVIGCIVDRQIAADRAWLIPYRLSQRIGRPGEPTFSFSTLLELSKEEVQGHMAGPPALHWLGKEMSHRIYVALRHIEERYEGKAQKIWKGRPSSARRVYRFLEFKGVGPKIATMAANILVRRFKIPVSDKYSIDISPDRHVQRVLHRLGLVPEKASTEQIIYRARDLNPEYPGLLDFPAFDIGRNWCKPEQPKCHECYMQEICPTAATTLTA